MQLKLKRLIPSENDITDIIDETFTRTEDRFGEIVTIELKPDGECVVSATAVRSLIKYYIADYEAWLQSEGDLGSDASSDDAAEEDDSDESELEVDTD